MKGQWLGYRLTSDELKALVFLCGGDSLEGVALGAPLHADTMREACASLGRKGWLWKAGEAAAVEQVLRFVIRQMLESSVWLKLKGNGHLLVVYRCPRMYLALRAPGDGTWQLLPLQRAEDAQELAFRCARSAGGHLNACVTRHGQRGPVRRLGEDWRRRLEPLWQLIEEG